MKLRFLVTRRDQFVERFIQNSRRGNSRSNILHWKAVGSWTLVPSRKLPKKMKIKPNRALNQMIQLNPKLPTHYFPVRRSHRAASFPFVSRNLRSSGAGSCCSTMLLSTPGQWDVLIRQRVCGLEHTARRSPVEEKDYATTEIHCSPIYLFPVNLEGYRVPLLFKDAMILNGW